MRKNIFITIIALTLLTISNVQAAVSPVAFGIVPPVQFPPKDFSITGLRLSVVGSHRDMYGVDLGLIGNITAQDFTGIAISGGFNKTEGTVTALGAQIAGLANWNTNKTTVYGIQAAALNMNKATSTVVGLDVALVNLTEQTAIYGLQAGLYNKARVVYGFQIGLVNEATDLHGIQIGIVNFHHRGLFAVCPIINMGF